ncbi:MAG: outer membrane protein assembly factor BamD [Bdellovibrionales bacterium]
MTLRTALLASFIALLAGCSSAPKGDPSTAEGSFALAEKYEKDERYEEALAQFTSVRNKHPYSSLATEAELRVAEIHFKREDYPEAQGAYESFKELHPSYARIDYITFRLGLSIFKQLPSTIDRDLALANKGLLYFEEVITSFPKSEYVAGAQEHKGKILEMLAEKELYIADFYFKREKYDSALGRYEDLLDHYPNSRFAPRALMGGAIAAARAKDESKSRILLSELERRFAGSKELRETKEALRAD